jgi:Ras-related protein Rab-11A
MAESAQGYTFKIVVLGDWAVGKTSLIRRHSKGLFELDTKPTLGVEVTTKSYKIHGAMITLSIWDIAGQEFASAVRHQYYAGTSAAILVFDLTRPETFWHVKTWYVDLRDHLQLKVPVVLMGNKKDLVDKKAITDGEIKELAEGYGFRYVETSASTGENVDQAFYLIIAQIVLQKKIGLDIFGIRET